MLSTGDELVEPTNESLKRGQVVEVFVITLLILMSLLSRALCNFQFSYVLIDFGDLVEGSPIETQYVNWMFLFLDVRQTRLYLGN